MSRAFVNALVVVSHGERTVRDQNSLDLMNRSLHEAILAPRRRAGYGSSPGTVGAWGFCSVGAERKPNFEDGAMLRP